MKQVTIFQRAEDTTNGLMAEYHGDNWMQRWLSTYDEVLKELLTP